MTPFSDRVLSWYDAHRRELPWRQRKPEPWATWVCEVMAQQTRIEVVLPALAKFLERFPTPGQFAEATDEQLQAVWRGLGYYRRARFLRDGAKAVVDRHGGQVPDTRDELRALPGVGDYTSAAIASIAFGRPVAAIDGNIERVLARHGGVRDDVRKALGRKEIQRLADERLDRNRAGDHNQALMDLGATVCTPRRPKCSECPLVDDCVAYRDGLEEELPVLPKRKEAVPVTARVVVIRADTGVLASVIPDGEINQGQFELPGPGVLVDHPEPGDVLRATLFERHGLEVELGGELARVKHGITHHRITLVAHHAEIRGKLPRGLKAIDPDHDSWSTPSRKVLERIDRLDLTAERS